MAKYYELFMRFPGFKTRALTLSYDDGLSQDRRMVPVLNRYGIKCTFNLNAGLISGSANRVRLEELEELYRGHEIASHAFTHPHLHNLDLGGIAYQIIRDRELLEETVRRPVEGFAYPYGLGTATNDMVDCLRYCGIRYARTTVATRAFSLPTDPLRFHPTCHHADPALFDLAEKFFAPEDEAHPWRITPKLFFLWGHSYEFENKWEDLERICETLGNKKEVWYATNGEVIDYLSAYRALRRSANAKYIYNPTDTDVYAFANNKNVLLKKGETTILE